MIKFLCLVNRIHGQVHAQLVEDIKAYVKKQPKDFRLIPGMEAHVEICTGQRRALEFVLYPFLKGLDGYNEHHFDLD